MAVSRFLFLMFIIMDVMFPAHPPLHTHARTHACARAHTHTRTHRHTLSRFHTDFPFLLFPLPDQEEKEMKKNELLLAFLLDDLNEKIWQGNKERFYYMRLHFLGACQTHVEYVPKCQTLLRESNATIQRKYESTPKKG
jgi:hypothetical protein